jgi:hypothetical protein
MAAVWQKAWRSIESSGVWMGLLSLVQFEMDGAALPFLWQG